MLVHPVLVGLLFTLSGVSGLIYQVLWVRVFGNQFGNSIHSASVVTATFMLGLGLGSFLAGRWVDRVADPRRPLQAYGWVEVAIGLWGLGLAALFPVLDGMSGALIQYRVDDAGWHLVSVGSTAARFAVAGLLLLPPTFLMGTTLTLLVRFLVFGQLALAGWRIALLFGLNTLGAALGAFLADFALVPSVGQFSTQAVAAVLNLVAGLGALRLARSLPEPTHGEAGTDTPPGLGAPISGTVLLVALGLFATGFFGMGIEILWFRFAAGLIAQVRAVFSILLTVVLVGMGLGSLLGGWLQRRFGRPVEWYVAFQALALLTTIFGFLTLDKHQVITGFYENRNADFQTWAGAFAGIWWPTLRPVAWLVGVPAVAMGTAFPLGNAVVQTVDGSIGQRAGLLYLANTAGAVAGSLVVGILWLPTLGVTGSAFGTFLALSLGVMAFAWSGWADRGSAGRVRLGAGVAAAFVGVTGWSMVPKDQLLRQNFLQLSDPSMEVLAQREGLYQSAVVVQTPRGDRFLLTNGYNMSANNPLAQRYMRAFSHLPLLQIEDPKKALVICFGVGNTADAARMHPIERLEIADISKEVLELAPMFSATNHSVLEKDKVEVFVNDGRNHLVFSPSESFDLVTMEPPPISQAGVASLYTVEYYKWVYDRLRSEGFASQWLPAYQVDPWTQLSTVAAFLEVFDNAVLLVGAGPELILLGQKEGPNQVDPQVLEVRLRQRPEVQQDLARVGLGRPVDMVAMFAADAEHLRQLTEGIPAARDDFPTLEHQPPSFDRHPIHPGLFQVDRVSQWCPSCFDEGLSPEDRARLRGRLRRVPGAVHRANGVVLAPDGQRLRSLPAP